MKLSIVIPVYYNADTLELLYSDIYENVITKIDYDYEIIIVNDGSKDESYNVMRKLREKDGHIKICSLSRNFGSHAAVLCGLENSTGDCAVIKAADLQEPSSLILDMVDAWKAGNNVVLAVRKERKESRQQQFFANLYYWLVRKFALENMPKRGFDIFLVDKKVIDVLGKLDENNSSITGQILWSGFRTAEVPYIRLAREVGESKWTLKKKVKLVLDTLYSFSDAPIKCISGLGLGTTGVSFLSVVIYIIRCLVENYKVNATIILQLVILFWMGILLISIGVLGEYLLRTLDAAKKRPTYIIEDDFNEVYDGGRDDI